MTRLFSLVPLTVLAGMVLAGCTPPAADPTDSAPPSPSRATDSSAPTSAISPGFVDRLDGSTATIPLAAAVLTELAGSAGAMEFTKTHQAYVNLIEGSKDLILVTHPSEEELALADQAGVELEVIPVVKDALVFLNNTANPVEGLTQHQVRGIYTGQITNWAEVGGPSEPIIAYQRQVNSGSQTLFLQLAMAGATPVAAPDEIRPMDMGALVDRIADWDNAADAVGYSVFYYATEMYLTDTARLMAIDGVVPSAQTISAEDYPYLTYYYAVLRQDTPADDEARQVVDWLLSDAGQQVAAAANYVPLDPANLVAGQPRYGYAGSTPDNTTQSSGTGGNRSLPVEWLRPSWIHCELNAEGYATSVTVDLHDAWTVPLTQWAQTTPQASCPGLGLTESLATVGVEGQWLVLLRDGTQAHLSDLFYDQVNYIEFINQNLFNEVTNTDYRDQLAVSASEPGLPGEADRPVGFTGIPADYPLFGVVVGADGADLQIYFPAGNPFFTQARLSTLRLPMDLSPYGRIWSTRWVHHPTTGAVMPVLATTQAESETDDYLNDQIAATVGAHPEWACFRPEYGHSRVTLVGHLAQDCQQGGASSTGIGVASWLIGTWQSAPLTIADLPHPWNQTFGWCGWMRVGEPLQTDACDPALFSDPFAEAFVWSDHGRLFATFAEDDRIYKLAY